MSKVNEKDSKSKNKRDIKSFFKNNLKVIIAFILGLIISGGGVYAATIIFNSDEVGFDNTNANLTLNNVTVDNVQDAIDALYSMANSTSFWVKKYKTFLSAPEYYAFGSYKAWCAGSDSVCNSLAHFPTTETTPPSGKKVYAAKYDDGQYGVCIKRNGTEYCFRAGNYIAESKHVQEEFSDGICHFSSAYVFCAGSYAGTDFGCTINTDGGSSCMVDLGGGTFESCNVYGTGYVSCS